MPPLRIEVQNFVRACETIQSLLARETVLTADEQNVIDFSALDLLDKVPGDNGLRTVLGRWRCQAACPIPEGPMQLDREENR
jgi:hypothetical protein